MIEEDISDLQDRVDELERFVNAIIKHLPDKAFYFSVNGEYTSIESFDSEEEAIQFVESQKTPSKRSFKKGSELEYFEVDEIKIKKELYL